VLETNSQYDVTPSSIFRIGHVTGVEGRGVTVLVDKTKNSAHLLYRGTIVRNTSVGGFVKIAKGFSEIVAKVAGESVGPERRNPASGYRSKRDLVRRELHLSIVGYFNREGEFKRGVQELPLLDNECFILTHSELEKVHHFVDEEDHPLEIGTLPMERDQPISIGVDAVFASHVGIFGNTGSGKSYTLAKLYFELFKTFAEKPNFLANAKFVLIDFNGEYVDLPDDKKDKTSTKIITERKESYELRTSDDTGRKIPLPESALRDAELWSVLLDATEKTQAPFLRRALGSKFLEEKLRSDAEIRKLIAQRVWDAIKVTGRPEDKQYIDSFLNTVTESLTDESASKLRDLATDLRTRLNFHTVARTFTFSAPTGPLCYANNPDYDEHFDALKDQIEALDLEFDLSRDTRRISLMMVFQYYWELFNGFANQEHLGPLMKRLESRVKRIDRVIKLDDSEELLKEPLTVFSLKDTDIETKKSIPLLLCKFLYAKQKKESFNNPDRYLNFIIDEAHTILSTMSSRESETWKDYRLETFEEIIKEGRKFGVFLTISSQRPYDIVPTIISQLHNYFLHRLVNELDIAAIKNSVAYLDRVSGEQIPILPTGDCVISGVSTSVPVIASIDSIPDVHEPNNKTPKLADKWLGKVDADGAEVADTEADDLARERV
jgi:DNA helicase HerA-like ATPase